MASARELTPGFPPPHQQDGHRQRRRDGQRAPQPSPSTFGGNGLRIKWEHTIEAGPSLFDHFPIDFHPRRADHVLGSAALRTRGFAHIGHEAVHATNEGITVTPLGMER
jgi:hypothetical protein